MNIESQIKELISEIVETNGYMLDEVLYEKEGSTYFLRIVIDKEPSVNIDDCVLVSRLINPLIDEKDLIKENYILDVCSKEKGN